LCALLPKHLTRFSKKAKFNYPITLVFLPPSFASLSAVRLQVASCRGVNNAIVSERDHYFSLLIQMRMSSDDFTCVANQQGTLRSLAYKFCRINSNIKHTLTQSCTHTHSVYSSKISHMRRRTPFPTARSQPARFFFTLYFYFTLNEVEKAKL
jgi:hypothetical protein